MLDIMALFSFQILNRSTKSTGSRELSDRECKEFMYFSYPSAREIKPKQVMIVFRGALSNLFVH